MEYLWLDKKKPSTHLEVGWSLPGGKPVDLPLLTFDCREFIPQNSAAHFIEWQVQGRIITVKLPPFAGIDTNEIQRRVFDFLEKSTPKVLEYILNGLEDELAALTMKEAMRYNALHNSSIINLALQIRCASFCSQGWGSVTGSETLGIVEQNFDEFGKSGYSQYDRDGQDRPLPFSIDHQIDVSLLLAAQEYQKRFVKELNQKIFQKGEKPWYEIFLATYVMLANLEYVHGGSYAYMQTILKTVGNSCLA